ncbi:MAG: hypothetical protein FWC68_00990 [Oscillospiraceae bacterium]|nr:hypothetical protein [Oscillospiraceae bacterium]
MNKRTLVIVSIAIVAIVLTVAFFMTRGDTYRNITYSIGQTRYPYQGDGQRGVLRNSNHRYTILTGQRSGGNSITIERVDIDRSGNVEIIVREWGQEDHGEGIGFLTVIIYPRISITFSERPNSIVVRNTNGEVFENINF